MPTKEQIAAALPKHVAKHNDALTETLRQYHEHLGPESPLFDLFVVNPDRKVTSIRMDVKEDHVKFLVVWVGVGFENLIYTPDTELKQFALQRFIKIIFKADAVHHKASVGFRKLVVDAQP